MEAEYAVTVILMAWLIAKAEGRHEAAAIRKAARKVRNVTKNKILYNSCSEIVSCEDDKKVVESQSYTLKQMLEQGIINGRF